MLSYLTRYNGGPAMVNSLVRLLICMELRWLKAK
jgi:hypothetical protein